MSQTFSLYRTVLLFATGLRVPKPFVVACLVHTGTQARLSLPLKIAGILLRPGWDFSIVEENDTER